MSFPCYTCIDLRNSFMSSASHSKKPLSMSYRLEEAKLTIKFIRSNQDRGSYISIILPYLEPESKSRHIVGARVICAPRTCSLNLYLALLTPDCAQPSERQLYGESLNQKYMLSVFQMCKANSEYSFAGVAHNPICLQNRIRTKGYCSSTGEISRKSL